MPRATKSDITLEMVRAVLQYDPNTGIVIQTNSGCEYKRLSIRMFNEVREIGRVIWLLHYGEWPPLDLLVDHKDRNRHNWKILNLRLATYPQNAYNAESRNELIKGVTFDANRSKKWRAQIRIKGRKTNLGRYYTMEEAAEAYKQAAIQYHGEFACLE